MSGQDYLQGRNDVWYTEDAVNWTNATSSAAWNPRYDMAPAAVADQLFLIGGSIYPAQTVNGAVWATGSPVARVEGRGLLSE